MQQYGMESLDEVIKTHVLKVLASTKNQKEASKILKISIKTIRNYLRRWNIPPQKNRAIMKNLSVEDRDRFINRQRIRN